MTETGSLIRTASWVAVEVASQQPLGCSILIMRSNLEMLDESKKYITESQLIEISNSLRQSVIAIRDWLGAQLDALEKAANGNAG
jgi:hypothetical protein